MGKILVVDDKASMAKMISLNLKNEGYETVIARDGNDAIIKLDKYHIDLVVTDMRMPGKDGLELLGDIMHRDNSIPVILMTAFGSINTAVEAVKNGAYDFLTKPFDPDHLIMIINRALEKQKLVSENTILKEELSKNNKLPRMIGKSPALLESIDRLKKVATRDTTVLLEGESGTGKELFARTLHFLSHRAKKPIISINCAAIPRDLMESELFGHEKGAFTGAEKMKIGKFELANGGTLFLDEIGDMNIELQAKMLRILESRELNRVGGNTKIKIDVRVVTATNKQLKAMVADGSFREDLYFRLNIIPITIPPLRERREDIRLLAEHYLGIFGRETKKRHLTISETAYRLMEEHQWRGNIRELKNIIERGVLLSNGPVITPEDLGLHTKQKETDSDINNIRFEGRALQEVTAEAVRIVERKMIKKVLAQTNGNKSNAARTLQVSYKTLLTKIKEYF